MRFLPLALLRLELTVRWTARALSVLLVGMVVVFMIGEGGFNRWKLSTIEAVLMAYLLTTCVGMLLAWWWPFLGGVMASAGILLFYAVDVAGRGGKFLNNLYFDLMLLTGLLFVLSAWLKRHMPVP
jgi:hypothetical protein